jgi:sigma-B regulation protein RsbU (phosphoserine phosphatase)
MKTLLLTPTAEVRRRFEPVLRSRGHDLAVCATAAEALGAAAAAPFELLVLDLTAPGPDGLEVCRGLRGAPEGAWYVILVITGGRRTRPLAEAIRLGADDYLLLLEEAEWQDLLDLRLTIAERKVRDNVARRRMLDVLTESEARYRALLEAAPDAVLVIDRDGRVELMNAQAERLSGYARTELLGRPVEVLMPVATRAAHVRHRRGFFERPATRPIGSGRDLALRRKDGSEVPVEIALAARGSQGSACAIAAARDVTERRRMQEELLHTREAAERAYQRLRQDLRAAAQVQRGLLPARPPCTEQVRFAWEYLPCAELGGDALNVFWLHERAIGLYLLDVSGHGVAAALLAVSLARLLTPATAQSTLLCVPRKGGGGPRVLPPAGVARWLNRWLLANPVAEPFVTLVYGILDTQTARFRYISAGHPPLLLVRSDGTLASHPSTGLPLGCSEASEFAEHELALRPGDRLFLYSDGILEAFNGSGEQFGAERLGRSVLAGRRQDARRQVSDLVATVTAWSGHRPEDDLSVLAVDIADGSAREPAAD